MALEKNNQILFDLPGHVGIAKLLHLPDGPWRFDAKLVDFIILQRYFQAQLFVWKCEAKHLEEAPRSLGFHIQKSRHLVKMIAEYIKKGCIMLHPLNPKLYVSLEERIKLGGGRLVKRSTKKSEAAISNESNTAKLHCMDLKSASQWLRAHLARLPPATAPPRERSHFEVSITIITKFRLGKQTKNASLSITLW